MRLEIKLHVCPNTICEFQKAPPSSGGDCGRAPAGDILRHVDAGRVGVSRLNRVFPILPYPRSRISEFQLLEPPFPVFSLNFTELGFQLTRIEHSDHQLIQFSC